MAKDAGGGHFEQLLINPVTDFDLTRPSYAENGEGYFLTASLMNWFWDHYADAEDRADPKASPLRASSLADPPPVAIFTSEFDPLRDEGEAYATALEKAGVSVEYMSFPGRSTARL